MGLPIIQIYMIVARQLSKPITGYFMKLGREHPAFRNRVLIPIGKAMTNWSTRLRMKNLGLGAPTSVANISDETALEQASEVIHQVAIFGYTVVVLYAYSIYTHKEEKEMATAEEVKELGKKLNQEITRLNVQCMEMQDQIQALSPKNYLLFPWRNNSSSGSGARNPATNSTTSSEASQHQTRSEAETQQTTETEHSKTTISRTEAMNRLNQINVISGDDS